MHGPHDRVPVEVLVLRSVHRHGVQLAPRFRWFRRVFLQRLTRHTSACFRSRAPGPVSGQLSKTPPAGETGDQRVRFPAAFRPPAFASWASCSRHGIPPPSRSAYHHTPGRDGPDGVSTFRTHETRPGRVPALPRERRYPRDRRTSSVAACRFATARSLSSPPPRPDPGSCRNEASPLVHSRSPFRSSPYLLLPGRNGRPWASLWASYPAITSHARQRRGPVQDTDRSHVFDIEVEPPIGGLLSTCDLVSHRMAA